MLDIFRSLGSAQENNTSVIDRAATGAVDLKCVIFFPLKKMYKLQRHRPTVHIKKTWPRV